MSTVPIRTEDRDPRVPALSIVFGYGPMVPILAAGAGVWLLPHPWPFYATSLGILWAAGILVFLAGVRRGLAFRTPGGERVSQIVTMMWLFVLGLGALAVPTAATALVLLILGYVSIAVLDPIAARREEAPLHFARLRPPQMAVALVGLAAMLAWQFAAVPPHATMV